MTTLVRASATTQAGARTVALHRRSGVGIDHRGARRLPRRQGIEPAGTRCERGVAQGDFAHRPLRLAGIANVDRVRMRPEHGEVTASIDHALADCTAAECLDRAIDRIALGNPAEIDPDVAVAKTHAAVGKQCDGVAALRHGRGQRGLVMPARQQADSLQSRGDAEVEYTRGTPVQIVCDVEHLEGPPMHGDRMVEGIPVEPADIARLVVEAHEPVHGRNCRECRLDGGVHRGGWCTGDGDLDEGSEQRTRAAHAGGARGHFGAQNAA